MEHQNKNNTDNSLAESQAAAPAADEGATRTGLALTQRAADRIKKIFADQEMPPDSCLRIGIKGGGCSGFSYVLDVTDKPSADDEVFASNGVRVVADPKSYLYLSGTIVDYEDSLLKGGFTFDNPNAKRSCGCGSSFSA
ncbi:MAG: iron-sulfur cluster assembly accessory protein [Planctomycetaceae bacterium]|nr:MAG: iron-sulfur cluster assembly accessory protein [Planctomycetaceae bacterium]